MPNIDAAKGRPCKALQGRRDRDPEQLSRERGTEVPSKIKQGDRDLGEKKPATLPNEQVHSLHKP